MVKIPRITLDMEAGVGSAGPGGTWDNGTGVQSEPQATLRLSRNGGKTWGNARSRTYGARGNYDQRVYWDLNGQGRAVVAEIEISDPVVARIANAYLGAPN